MNDQPIRVLLADDHPILLAALRALLERHGYLIVGEAKSGEEAIPLAARYAPQVVIMDLEMPGLGGLASIPRIRAVAPAAKILILSAHDERCRSHERSCPKPRPTAIWSKATRPKNCSTRFVPRATASAI